MDSKPNTIVFFGTPDFAVPSLEALMAEFSLGAVFTAPDAPRGRGMKIQQSPVSLYLERHGYTGLVIKPSSITAQDIETIASLKPTVGVVVAYGLILPKKLIECFPSGIINLHPSLLPHYRGPSPLQSQILSEDKEFGVSIMQLDEKMDHGPILSQEILSVDPSTITYPLLHDLAAKKGAECLIKTLTELFDEAVRPIIQDDTKATYTKLLTKEDGLLNWKEGAPILDRRVRALNPWPGTYTFFNGKRLKILTARSVVLEHTKIPGTVFYNEGLITVACGQGALILDLIQGEGESPVQPVVFTSKYPEFNSVILTSSI
jgi:methionyl-tRNA formyltransferase